MTQHVSTRATSAVFWNVWGHRHADDIHSWLQRHMPWVDVIGLTEVTDYEIDDNDMVVHTSTSRDEPPSRLNGRMQLERMFSAQYEMQYTTAVRNKWTCSITGSTFNGVGFGSALLYRKGLRTVAQGDVAIVFDNDRTNRMLQWLVYDTINGRYLIAHMHGVWIKGNTKGDHPIRLEQARQVRKMLARLARVYLVDHTVFGGDLNLSIDTNALAALEYGPGSDITYRNLIKELGITSTRTPSYRKFEKPGESMHADYVLVSPNVEVTRFEVDTSEMASDHAPVLLGFK